MKYLGIDYGTKKIGIAVSDDTGTLAFPRGVIPNNVGHLDHVLRIIQEEGIDEVIVGNSVTGSGVENMVMTQVRQFIESIGKKVAIPVTLANEFGTTAAVYAAHQYTDAAPRRQASPSSTQKKNIDDQAAAMILQRFLDSRKK